MQWQFQGAQLVHGYSQGRDFSHVHLPRWGADPAARIPGAMCKSICVHWLIKHAKGEDFWSWIKTVRGTASIVNTQVTGEYHYAPGRSISPTPGAVTHDAMADRDDWIPRTLSAAGLLQMAPDRRTGSFGQAADWILHDTGQYKLIGLRGTGGHAVAAHVGESVLFMDPNLGEVTFPAPGNFMVWFPKFVSTYTLRDTNAARVKRYDTVIVRSYGVTRPRR